MYAATRRDRCFEDPVHRIGALADAKEIQAIPGHAIHANATHGPAIHGQRLERSPDTRPRDLRLVAGVANAAEPTATVVEFHNAALDQFFVTASPAEAATLARWFGANAEQLAGVFPNPARFSAGDIGLMT